MKTFNLIKRLWTDSHEKQSPQRFARFAAMLIMLLTIGLGQMWADNAGFFDKGAGIITYSKNEGSDTNHSVDKTGSSTSDFGTVTSFWLKGWQIKMWKNNGGNVCDYGKMYYRIYLTSGSGGSFTTLDKASTTWSVPKTNHIYHNGGSLNTNLLSGLVGGVYYFEFYFKAQGNWNSGSGCDDQYLSNGSSNYKIKFKYDPKYTVTVSAGSNGSVASTSVTAGNIDAVTLPTATANTGYHFNNWTTASSNLTLGNTTSATAGTVKARAAGTVTANFAANTYTVAYNANNDQYPGTATGSTSSSSHTYGTAKALTSNGFSRAGYTFAGWATTPTGSVAYTNGQSVTNLSSTQGATVTLYAKWTENKSNITLVASPSGKGTFQVGGVTVTSTQAGVTTTPEVTAVPIAGYSFSGWSITGGATISSTSTNPTTVTGGGAGTAATLTATFEEDLTYYDVTFGVGTSYTSLGSISATNNTTSSAISSGDAILSASNITFTATPNTGYVVEGWYTDAACTAGKHDEGSTTYTIASLSSAVTVYVKFIPITYTITYNLNSGSNPGGAPTSFTIESSDVTLPTPTRTGYTFNGWYANPDLSTGGVHTKIASGSTGNKEYWAKWTENKRNVTISVSPSGAGTLNKTSASVGVATTTTVTATAQPGYRFTGWTATNCSVASTSSASTTLSGNGTAGSGTLVANFARTYAYLEGRMTVYNAARSTETNIASTKGGWDKSSTRIGMDYDGTNHVFYCHTYKTPAELSAQQNSEYQWFSFKTSTESGTLTSPQAFEPASNQEMSSTGSANKKTISAASTSKHIRFNSSDASGYALLYFDEAGVWYELEQSLKYNANGGSGDAPTPTYYLKGTNATAASNPFTARAYYTFGGWNTAQYITGTNYAAGASVTMNANITLYAKWTRTVTLNQEDATTPGTTSVTGTYNCATLPSIINPSKTGYTFGGWYTEVAGGGNIIINTSGALQADKYHWTDASGRFDRTTTKDGAPLYAKWTQTVTLNANLANHGSGSNKSATIVYKATDKSSITHCTPATGYHLVGYYTDATGGTKILNADGSFAATNITNYITDGKWTKAGATTLYAQYEVNTYTIHYDPNDDKYVGEATGSMDDQAATWGNYPTLTSNGFTREGYTFAGWATSPTGAVVYSNGQTLSTNLTNDNNATVTLYAKWTGRTYTVTFNARGGSSLSPASKTVTMGATYGTLATVTPPAGYVFDGWYTSAGSGTKVTSATQVTTAVDHTLYAHYIQKAQVYFKNTIGWSKVYVTYDSWWNGDGQGAGNEDRKYHKMKLVSGTTDVYYDDIPDEYLTSWRWNIAFDNTGFCADEYKDNPTTGTYHGFNTGEAVFRYDFDKNATMFVPTSNTGTSADGNYTKNGVQYRSTGYKDGTGSNPEYTSGYWRTYNNTYSGYTMTYQKKDGPWSSGHKMESSSVSSNVFIYTVHMDANSQYNFAFYKERDVNFKSVQFCYDHNTQITSNNCTNLVVKCEPQNSWMQTTVEGDYVFKLEMKNDGHMYLTVEYPFKANDYKVVYSYTKDGAKTYDSEIIRGRANGLDTISVFIHSSSDASYRSLQIATCTGINASGVPTWNNSYATIDISSVSESGVYNFIITQDGSAAATGAYWNKYTGNYYIRTESSDGGWDMYKYRPDNIMTLSEYSLTQTLSDPFSHYYCRFIGSTSVDITYAVATDYSPNISGTMTGDATIGGGATTLPATANVRFSWNEKTNAMRRAYLKNAQGAGNNRYLVLHGADNKIRNNDATGTEITPSGDLAANELLFYDLGNWVYQVELKAIPGAKVSLIANYNSADRYLVGDGDTKWETIIGGTGSSPYSIKAVYDFKTNRLMTAWIPGGDITEDISDVDVLLLRYAQDAGTAITFGGDYTVGAKEVIGAIEMRYNDLVGHVAAWTSSSRPLLKFFVSFPFDVNVSDIFGLNSAYGDAYIVEEYDGAGRAEKGFFGGDGTTTFWKELQPGDVMLANVGYCVILDNDYFNGDIGNIWDNKGPGSSVYLYFPSASSVGDIKSSSETISIPEHLCHHDRTFITGGSREVNHINTDSHWNMMGVPIFDTHSDSGTSGQPGAVFATGGTDGDGNFNYFYEWNPSNNQFSIHTAVNYSFKCMHGYMVQYHGNVTFKTAAAPASVAARRAPQKENYQIELQVLNNNADVLNSAFVELRENACDTFELNEDVYMSFNNLAVNIYTLAGNYDVAANVLSVGNHTIPVGVKVTKAGTYRFSMPGNFSGEVTLLDTFTGESTNLALDDYEVELPKGTTEDRFFLKTNIKKVATAIDGISEDGSLKDGKAHKFLQNGVMYILQNGVLYDAQGKRVQ